MIILLISQNDTSIVLKTLRGEIGQLREVISLGTSSMVDMPNSDDVVRMEVFIYLFSHSCGVKESLHSSKNINNIDNTLDTRHITNIQTETCKHRITHTHTTRVLTDVSILIVGFTQDKWYDLAIHQGVDRCFYFKGIAFDLTNVVFGSHSTFHAHIAVNSSMIQFIYFKWNEMVLVIHRDYIG